jgi:uncharacterized protein Usg
MIESYEPDKVVYGKRIWIGVSTASNEDMLYFQDSPRDALDEALTEIAESSDSFDTFPSCLQIYAWKEYDRVPTSILSYSSTKLFIDLAKDHLEETWADFDYAFPATQLSIAQVQALQPFLTKAYIDWAKSQNIDPNIKECWAIGGENSSVTLYLTYTPTLEEISAAYDRSVTEGDALLSDLVVDITPDSAKDFEQYELHQRALLRNDVGL